MNRCVRDLASVGDFDSLYAEKMRVLAELKKIFTPNIEEVSESKAEELGRELYRLISNTSMYDRGFGSIKDIINKGANLNVLVHERNSVVTPLIHCARKNKIEIAKLLIAAGADVNAHNNYLTTALMDSARRGHLDFVKLLVWSGADVNARCLDDDTALISAARHGCWDCVKFLVDNQADLTVVNLAGKSAFDFGLKVDVDKYVANAGEHELTFETIMDTIEKANAAVQKLKNE